MSRVAVLGSCITRDLWPRPGEAPPGLLYISRTSLPSLFAPSVEGFRPEPDPPAGLGRFQHRAMVWDLTKSALARLAAFRPTHLIVDFIDERFDLLTVNGSVALHSWELETSGYLAQPAFQGARPIRRLSPACERLWRRGAEEFAAFVRATPLCNAALILHAARWADRSRDDDGRERPLDGAEILPGRPADIAAQNALLARYEACFLDLMPPMARVEAPEHRLADPRHRWGASPFHYVTDYYRSIRRQLAGLGVTDFGEA